MDLLFIVENIFTSGLPVYLIAIGIFLTFRLLDFADMTAEGSFLIARCISGTTEPSWSASGDTIGRIYNKTNDIDVSSGLYDYNANYDWPGYNP